MKNVLLIGNGPAALSKEMGDTIDTFDGDVVRFNNYTTGGYEKYVGSRTDIWVTCERNVDQMVKQHKQRLFISWRQDEATARTVEATQAERVPRPIMMQCIKTMGFHSPSSGAIATEYFMFEGYTVWIWGFDYLCQRRQHHYNKDGQERGQGHDGLKEWMYFHKLNEQGKVHWFGLEEGESTPIYRQPVPCGKDHDISWYREAAHNAWYEWFGSMSEGKIALDVGAGLCKGMKILDKYCSVVNGIEVDERLAQLDYRLMIGSLDNIASKSYDVITCVDVIEHVVKDMELMNNMKRIAREKIFITTPCYVRSQCGNIAHCREYSIPQFMNLFQPTEIWSASPDGTIHRTKVLSRENGTITNYSNEGPDNEKNGELIYHTDYVPIDTKFNYTVDGEEWAHIAAIFDL